MSLFRPNPSCLVKKATVKRAKNERQNESSSPASVVHLINSPPELQINAAAKTKSRDVVLVLSALGLGPGIKSGSYASPWKIARFDGLLCSMDSVLAGIAGPGGTPCL